MNIFKTIFQKKLRTEISSDITIANAPNEDDDHQDIQQDVNPVAKFTKDMKTAQKAETGVFTDTRDGKSYRTITISGITIMAENFAFYTSKGLSWAYDNDQDNIPAFGYLYDWETAKYVCPTGWHLPTKEEFEFLMMHIGTNDDDCTPWLVGGESGFDAPLGGYRHGRGGFYDILTSANIWSSQYDHDSAWSLYIDSNSDEPVMKLYSNACGFSARYIKDNAKNTQTKQRKSNESCQKCANSSVTAKNSSKIENGLFTDNRDGKSYKTVKIGNKTILAENFAFKPSSGRFWAYNDDEKNVEKYGYLYDLKTAVSVCPAGWHIPSHEEFQKILKLYGSESEDIYNAMIMGGQSGFEAKLAGCLDYYSFYNWIEEKSFYWCSTEHWDTKPFFEWVLQINSLRSQAFMCAFQKTCGFSVRLIKD